MENDPAARQRGLKQVGKSTLDPVRWNQVRFIRSGIAASAIAHLSVLTLVLLFAEVHPFGSVTAEPIAVDIVTPEEVAEQKPENRRWRPKPEPSDAARPFREIRAARIHRPAPAAAAGRAAPQQAGDAVAATSAAAAVASRSRSRSRHPHRRRRRLTSPPQPDLSIKYHVMLGLPPDLPPDAPAREIRRQAGDPFDGPASQAADIASSLVSGVSASSQDMLQSCRHRSRRRTSSGSSCGCS